MFGKSLIPPGGNQNQRQQQPSLINSLVPGLLQPNTNTNPNTNNLNTNTNTNTNNIRNTNINQNI
jgi:hypothetical protein